MKRFPLGFFETVQGGDLGMAQGGKQLSSTLGASQPFGVMCKLVRQNLDRYLPGEVRVLGAVDLSYPILAELFGDAVV
jgi:hypothetical protein